MRQLLGAPSTSSADEKYGLISHKMLAQKKHAFGKHMQDKVPCQAELVLGAPRRWRSIPPAIFGCVFVEHAIIRKFFFSIDTISYLMVSYMHATGFRRGLFFFYQSDVSGSGCKAHAVTQR